MFSVRIKDGYLECRTWKNSNPTGTGLKAPEFFRICSAYFLHDSATNFPLRKDSDPTIYIRKFRYTAGVGKLFARLGQIYTLPVTCGPHEFQPTVETISTLSLKSWSTRSCYSWVKHCTMRRVCYRFIFIFKHILKRNALFLFTYQCEGWCCFCVMAKILKSTGNFVNDFAIYVRVIE